VRLDESKIDIPGAESAGVTDFVAKAAPVATRWRRSGLANARPWRQSQLNKPVIRWMSEEVLKMAGRRVLSQSEKSGIKKRRLTQELALQPTSNFDIRVADETDDRGQPIVVVIPLPTAA